LVCSGSLVRKFISQVGPVARTHPPQALGSACGKVHIRTRDTPKLIFSSHQPS
jgi:hypothetical protein